MNENQYLSNRDKVKQSRRTKFWCIGCDRMLVYEGEKCKICGTINNSSRKRRFRK